MFMKKKPNNNNPLVYSLICKKVILFANVRDEKNIKEWCAHHLLLGFDAIVIFDHNSNPPLIHEMNTFDRRVSIVRVEMENPVKIRLMKRAVQIALKNGADWMLYLDADEFLVLNSFQNVKQMLNTYRNAHSLSINWLMFGTNHHVKTPKGLMVENFTSSELIPDMHVKSFVRPFEVIDVTNPHYFCIRNPKRMLSVHCKTMTGNYAFHPINQPFYNCHAYIAHYHYQSEESYTERKIRRAQDDGSGQRPINTQIHEYHNNTINTQIKDKYAEKIKRFLHISS
jgi:hypothetical protein